MSQAQAPGFPAATILNVDDTDAMRYARTRILMRAGFAVVEAQTGQETLDLVQRAQPDLVVLDVKLPDMSGLDVCARIKQAHPQVLVLQTSAAFVASGDRVRGLENGADAYLTAPAEADELLASVRALLRMRRAEEAARIAERRWQSTFDAIRDGIGLFGPDGALIQGNGALAWLIGLPADILTGCTAAELWPGHPILGGGGERQVTEIAAGDRILLVTADPLPADEGGGWVCVLSDITERRLAERAVEDSERRYRFMADTIPQIVWTADARGRMTFFNRRLVEVTGEEGASLQDGGWFGLLHPDDRTAAAEAWGKALETGSEFQYEHRIRCRGGGYRWFLSRARPMRDGEGAVTAWFGSFTDVDDVKRKEETLAALLTQKELLFKEVNHRVKNSLQLVSSLLQLQRLSLRDPAAAHHLDDAVARVNAIAAIHERLYRSDDVTTVDFATYLSILCKDLEQTVQAGGRTWSVAVTADDVTVPTDEALPMALIVNELVTNAIKHSNPASDRCRVEVRYSAGPQRRLSVTDQGVGLPADFTLKPGRSSLGMDLVTALTRQLKGRLEVERLDPGTRFTVVFV